MIALLEANTWFDLPRVYNKAKLCFLLPPLVESGLLAFFFFFFFFFAFLSGTVQNS
jgi:hypothetical protein